MSRSAKLRAVSLMAFLGLCVVNVASAQDVSGVSSDGVDLPALLRAGGTIGVVIAGLSVAMVALIVEHLLSIRRGALMPRGLAEKLQTLLVQEQYQPADKLCRESGSFLGHIVSAGLQEVGLGYPAVEKALEDASVEQSAHLFRKIEYLSVISAIAPMLGLMGTVWGMIVAFGEFTQKANPQPADFAPGISQALVTTLMGLCVAVPALAAFALFRNRVDEYVAEASLLAEHLFQPYKRSSAGLKGAFPGGTARSAESRPSRRPVPPVALEREQPS